MFKKLLVLLSMLAALAMSAVAFAAPAKSHQQMVIDAARAEVPSLPHTPHSSWRTPHRPGLAPQLPPIA